MTTMDGRWAKHRKRAEALTERYPFAMEMLTLYVALLDVWEESAVRVLEDRPEPDDLPQWTVEWVLPGVVKAAESAGPAALHSAVRERTADSDLTASLVAWLRGDGLEPVDRFLARAALTGPLNALPDETVTDACTPSEQGERWCPRCGGPPQLSYRTGTDDGLVSGQRYLLCVRCGQDWAYSASACPSCGETTGSKRTVYGESRPGNTVGRANPGGLAFPQLRVEACAACQRYVVDVDLGADPHAVAEVDELVAVPLDLYAAEQGHTKLTPNLMGV